MPVSRRFRFAVAVVCALAASLLSYGEALAERALVQVTPGEFRRLGYQDKDEFIGLYTQCVQIANDLKKRNVCSDDECVKKSREWQANSCEKHATAMFYLTSIDPARHPVGEVFDNAERANYLRLYTASCQDGYKNMNPGRDPALVKNTCDCAATQSLELIEYGDYKVYESTKASKEVIDRVKNRAAYARFICDNKPAVWREQPGDTGAAAAQKSGGGGAASIERANLDDAQLLGLFEQLKNRGTTLYNSLLAKLKAEAGSQGCQADPRCVRSNEALGAIYKDILYVAYATQLYKTTGQDTRPLAKARLNEFIKATLVSIDANIKLLRGTLDESVPGESGAPPLTRPLRDAEECQKLLTTISRELARR